MMSSVSSARTVGDIAAMLNLDDPAPEEPDQNQGGGSGAMEPPQGQTPLPTGTDDGNISPPPTDAKQPGVIKKPDPAKETDEMPLPNEATHSGDEDTGGNEEPDPPAGNDADNEDKNTDTGSEDPDKADSEKQSRINRMKIKRVNLVRRRPISRINPRTREAKRQAERAIKRSQRISLKILRYPSPPSRPLVIRSCSGYPLISRNRCPAFTSMQR